MSSPAPGYFARSVAGGFLARGVSLVAGLVVTGLLVDRLGAGGYGLWVVLTTIATFASALDGGVLGGLSRHVAILRGAGRRDDTELAVMAALVVYGVLGVAAVALAWLVTDPVADLLKLPADVARATVTTGLLLAVAAWAVGNVWQAAAAAAEGAGRMPAANGLRAGVHAAVAVAVVVVALTRPTVTAVLVAGLLATAAAGPLALVLLQRWTGIVPRGGAGLRLWIRAEVTYGFRLQISQVSYLSRDLVDRVVIGALLGVSSVAGYHVAFRIASITAVVPGILLATALPMAARRVGSGTVWEADEMNQHGRRLLAVSAVTLGSTAAGYTNLAHAWVGDAAAGTYIVFALVASAFFISNSTGVLTTVLRAEAVLAPEMWGAIVAAVLNVPLTLWLATQFGLHGVVLASAVATLFGNVAYLSLVRGVARTHALHQVRAGLLASVAVLPALVLGGLAPLADGRGIGLVTGVVLVGAGGLLTVAALAGTRLLRSHDLAYVRGRWRP